MDVVFIECGECGHEVEVSCEFDPGEAASWGYSGGSPAVPPSVTVHDAPVTCASCGTMFDQYMIEGVAKEHFGQR